MPDDAHVLDHSELVLDVDFTYSIRLVVIIDRKVKALKIPMIPYVLVMWNQRSPGEATWEREDVMQIIIFFALSHISF